MERYQDPNDPLNGPEHQTGKLCIEKCGRIAGTHWSPYYCQPCNAARMDRISDSLNEILKTFETQKT